VDEEKPFWTDADDEEVCYGETVSSDANSFLAELKKLYPVGLPDEVWPHWSEGVPKAFKRIFYCEPFWSKGVSYQSRFHPVSLSLQWQRSRALPDIQKSNRLLPDSHFEAWSGVYRIFTSQTPINRVCGIDSTGTLYIGRAGTSERKWSILRTRVQSVLSCTHHAMSSWQMSDGLRKQFPWESLSIEWAYTGEWVNLRGETVPEAVLAESMLLSSYNDSFGEYPPLNQKG
jgi:hypothetical protein